MRRRNTHEHAQYNLGKLYHGTSLEQLPDILKNGLDPSQSQYADEEREDDIYGRKLGPPYHFVYLSDYHRLAEPYDKGAMLEIRLPSHLQDKLILDRGEFVRAPFVILPQYIKVVGGTTSR